MVIERFLDADRESVYSAWTDPVLMARWFFVGDGWRTEAENELRVGGSFRLTMYTAEGERHVMHGEYLEIEPPHRLCFTWSSHVVAGTTVTLELEARGKGTHLKLTHHMPDHDDVRRAHELGWQGCLDNLLKGFASSVLGHNRK